MVTILKVLHCPNCGGDVEIQENFISAICPYCNSKIALSPEDLGINKVTSELLGEMFAGQAVGTFLKQQIKKLNRDEFWKENAHKISLECTDGTIEISYIHKAVSESAIILTARSNVILLFEDIKSADKYCNTVKSLKFPQNDVKNLRQFVPNITGRFTLINNQAMVVIEKGDNEYPLSAFKNLPDVHAAWVVSRLENLCCLLQFNNISIPKFGLSDLYVDSEEHQIYFYGGFESSMPVSKDNIRNELLSLRQAAANVMGCKSVKDTENKVPKDFYEFLNGEPKENPFEDFKQWDLSLTLAYGKRTFRKLDCTENSIYSN